MSNTMVTLIAVGFGVVYTAIVYGIAEYFIKKDKEEKRRCYDARI